MNVRQNGSFLLRDQSPKPGALAWKHLKLLLPLVPGTGQGRPEDNHKTHSILAKGQGPHLIYHPVLQ